MSLFSFLTSPTQDKTSVKMQEDHWHDLLNTCFEIHIIRK